MPINCNIDKTDRINRIIIGLVLLIAALLGASAFFYMMAGLILIVEGLIGWCSIPFLLNKMRPGKRKKR